MRALTVFALGSSALLLACSEAVDEPGGDGDSSSATGGFSAGGSGTGASPSSGGTPGAGGTFGTAFDLILEEDSPALCGHLSSIRTSAADYAGPGYLVSEERLQVGVSWVVAAAAGGSFDLGFRYAAAGAKSVEILVGHEVVQTVELPETGGGWSTHEVSVDLVVGQNHVSIRAVGVGLVDIDSLSVRGQGASAGDCSTYAPGAGVSYEQPIFDDQSVHDPSILETGGTYYVFGSHLAAAKTTDLMDWDLVAGDGVNPSNPLFENVVTELAEAFAHSTVTGLWAADVLQLRSTGKFLMYYNSCEGSSPLSAMGIASSDEIEGPYVDEGSFLYSGGSGYNASVLPNAIDPDTFYDPQGSLWMIYGSYSGGIFIMEMDEATGFPEEGEEFGTHLLGGNHIQIEGPFIQYSPNSEYYYMFTSYGGLAAGDGYNMRVARATTPRGPYYDHDDVDQASFTSEPKDPSGVKVMGDYQFLDGPGYVSPGHNSTYYDEETGRYFLVFHTRFPGQGNFHQIRVHEMYINVDGWPVAAPLRYAPRFPTEGDASAAQDYVGRSEVAGTYEFINHGRDTSGNIKQSVSASVEDDGILSGEVSGSWTFGGNNVAVFTLDGEPFRGVLSRQWNQTASEFQITFAGVSAEGETLWGIRTGG